MMAVLLAATGVELDARLPALALPAPVTPEQALLLLDRLGLEQAHWVGEGAGATAGIAAAAGCLHGRLRRLVLCAPATIDWAAWERLTLPVLVLGEIAQPLAERLRTQGPRALVLAPGPQQRRGVIERFLLAA